MQQEKTVNAGIRLGSMILDHFIMTMVCMVFYIPIMIKVFSTAFTISHEETDIDPFSGPLSYVAILGFSLYFCKDCINGRSLGKRILKLQVVSYRTGEVASSLKCFVRNIFCVIWPIELIVTLINPARRIGDMVAGTKVVNYDPATTEQPKVDIKKLVLPLIFSYSLWVLFMLPFQNLKSSFTRTKYVEGSYNDIESKSLEKLYSDSLDHYLTASVRVYDKVQDQELKYISVIYRLKNNYLNDENDSKEIKRLTNQVLYSFLPQDSFIGIAKYVYQSRGSMQVSSNQIGTRIYNRKNGLTEKR